jgi:hypothetical protein
MGQRRDVALTATPVQMDYAREFMTKSRLRRLVPIVLATVVAQNGCATAHPAPGLKPAQLGTIGIVVSALRTEVHLGAPPLTGAGAGAARGATANTHALLEAAATVGFHGGGVGGAFAALVLVALVPFAAGVGAIVGAIGAPSTAEVARSDSTLKAAFELLDSAHAIRRQLLEVIREQSLQGVVMVDESSPGVDRIDTVLELDQITISLKGPDSPERDIDPAYEFKMEVHTRLIRPDGSRLHGQLFEVTKDRKFVDWAAHDAEALRAVTDRATRELAENILDRYLRKPVLVDPDRGIAGSPRWPPVPSTYSSDRLTPPAEGIRDGVHRRAAPPPRFRLRRR